MHRGGQFQPVLVVIQQQPPGPGVTQDQTHRLAAQIRHQLLPGQGLAQQLDGLGQLLQPPLGQPVFVETVTLGQVFAQHAGGPLAEAGGAGGVDPVAHRDDGLQVVVPEPPLDLAFALLTNYREFLGSYPFFQLIVFEYVFKMKVNIVGRRLEQIRHLCLSCPQGLPLQPNLHLLAFTLENHHLAHVEPLVQAARHQTV